ncbi:MAG: aminotransferase class I/II-fold pyridoxal phosphate-dependent enzyme, partial [Hyphomicrobium sp.]|nr:aminotransferase class I/II-fold pyridoxal phosphate-dependent enzyme [Hyphomicrobium sp.]
MTEQAIGPGFATLALHAGAPADPASAAGTPPTEPPAGVFEDMEQATALFGLEGFGSNVAQSVNPANALLEERIAALEGGTAALAVASGRAAQFLALHMLLQPGDEFIAGCGPHSGQMHQIDQAYKSFGWGVKCADQADPNSFEPALTPQTKAIVIESFTNPGGQIIDIAAVAEIAKKARIPLIVDNTLATPYLLQPFAHGADIVLHSATKFLGGHDTLTGGLIVDGGTFDWQGDVRFPMLSAPRPDYGGMVFAETFGNFAFAVACRIFGLNELGPTLSPFNAFLIVTGLETLALRMQRHSENALRVADYLAGHKALSAVNYPGLASDPAYALAKIYCPRGAGGLLTCRLAGG